MSSSSSVNHQGAPPPYQFAAPTEPSRGVQAQELDDLDSGGRRMVPYTGHTPIRNTPQVAPPPPRRRVYREPFEVSDETKGALKWISRCAGVAGVIAGTVVTVKLKEAHTSVNLDPAPYIKEAHNFYINCYEGSNGTNPNFGPDNCALTNSSTTPDGTDCHWQHLWYKADNIPQPCLTQMVPQLQAQALSSAKNAQKRYYGLFALTIPAFFLAPIVPWAAVATVEGIANIGRY